MQNKDINLCKILRHCQKGTNFWSPLFGDVKFKETKETVVMVEKDGATWIVNSNGTITFGTGFDFVSDEIMLFPSKDQRDWHKFLPPGPKFDPRTLKPFDKVLVKTASAHDSGLVWRPALFSHLRELCLRNGEGEKVVLRVYTISSDHDHPELYVVPYTDKTEYLVGTKLQAPKYYRYWED